MSTRFGINFITPATTVFSLRKQGLHGVDSIFAGTPNLENIRVLRFSRYNGTLRELIKIVKLLPNLSTLECVSGRIDFESDSTQFVNFIDGIYQDIYPLSHRFRHWKFIDENDYEIRPVTETALAFAILCTNFTFTRVPQGYRGYFRINIEKFIASGLYDKHIGRIQRLLRISN
ncbi:hypothetical protein IWW48_000869 [Coemansia sp. RSA 1200]|nr:hypothetical protein IWW48_000869 [Coemansia sp. RSA 1200]